MHNDNWSNHFSAPNDNQWLPLNFSMPGQR